MTSIVFISPSSDTLLPSGKDSYLDKLCNAVLGGKKPTCVRTNLKKSFEYKTCQNTKCNQVSFDGLRF